MPDWRNPWPPVVKHWRDDQIASQATWTKVGNSEDSTDHGIAQAERDATGLTIVNPLDITGDNPRQVPGSVHGHRPVPAGRY